MSTRMFILSPPLVYISHDTDKDFKNVNTVKKRKQRLFHPYVFNISLPSYI